MTYIKNKCHKHSKCLILKIILLGKYCYFLYFEEEEALPQRG